MKIAITGSSGFLAQSGQEPAEQVAVIRFSNVIDATLGISKYGAQFSPRVTDLVDRSDVAEVVHRSPALRDLAWEVFHIDGHSGADRFCDAAYTRRRLNWSPQFADQELEKLYH